MSNRFSIEAVFSAKDGISAVIAKIGEKVNGASKGMAAGLTELQGVTSRATGALADMAMKAAAVGAVIGAGLLHVVKVGADFEQAITNVGAVSGKGRNQIQDLEKAALSLGVTTQFSATEVANGMEMMARKGFTTEEILKGIPGVLNAVAASGQDMATVAGIVGSSIRGFGLDAGDASHVANVLAFASAKTGATITDLGSALATAAPTAKALGVSLEDTTAAVGLLQRMGIDASTAGSATATMLAKITKPSKEVAAQMATMGVKFKDAKGNMLPFNQVLGQFVKVGDKAGGNMDRMAFFAELVGLRGDKAALGLAEMAKTGDFQKLSDGLQHVGDFAGDVAKIRMDTTLGSWKLLTSTVEVLETKLFGLKSGALRGVIDSTNAWIAANQDLIVSKVQDFIQGIADNMPKIVTWGERILKVVGIFLAFAAAAKTASTAVDIVSFAAKNPYVALALAVIAAVALIVAFWPEIKAFFSNLWEHIKTIAAAVGGWFAEMWTRAVSALMTVWSPIGDFFSRAWGVIKAIVVGVVDFIVGLWTLEFMALLAIVRAVVAFFRPIWEPILEFFAWLWDGVKQGFILEWDAIVAVATAVFDLIQAIWAPISAFFALVWGGVKVAAISVWDAIVAKATEVFAAVKAIWAPIGAFFSGLWDGVAAAFSAALGWVVDKVEALVGNIMKAVHFVQGVGAGTLDGSGGGDPNSSDPGAPALGGSSSQPGSGDGSDAGGGFYGEVTVRAAPGTSAAVTKAPTGGHQLNVAPSGGF